MSDKSKQKAFRTAMGEQIKSGNIPRASTWGGKPSSRQDRKRSKSQLRNINRNEE